MPNIRQLLLILATLPVTTAEAERLFSKVERTATAARAHMTEDRLEALVMINTHRRLTPDCDSIITRFAGSPENRYFRLPHCRLTPRLKETPRISAQTLLILPETAVIALHLCRL